MTIIATIQRRKKRFYRSLTIAIGVCLLAYLAAQFGFYESPESKAIDIFFNLQAIISELAQRYFGVPPPQPPPTIVIVDIDDDAFANLGKRAPLPRWYLAALIDVVARAGAKVIAYDIDLTVATDQKDDALLLHAIQQTTDGQGTGIVFSYFDFPRPDKNKVGTNNPETIFAPKISAVTGFANITTDPDGVVRELPLARRNTNGRVRPSFALAAVTRYSDYGVGELDDALNRNDKIYLDLRHWDRDADRMRRSLSTFAFRADDHWKINFSSDQQSFLRIPSDLVYKESQNTSSLPQQNIFRDKIVLIGGTFLESRDFYTTPDGPRSGVEIHASAIHTILSRSQIRSVHPIVFFLVLVSFALLTSLALTLLQPSTVAYLTYVLIPVLFLGSYLSLRFWGLWIDLITPVLVMSWGATLAEFLSERSVMRSLAEFINEEVIDQIVEEEQIPFGGIEATLFFTDVRDFTTICEGWSPIKIVSMMNDFFAMIGDVLKKHDGCIIDFVGDGVFAVFGVLKNSNSNHANRAVAAALEIQDRMHTLNLRWRNKGLPALTIGIGIHTGTVVVGVVGGGERKKFSVTGDPVNVGAQIKGLNKEFSTSVLITEDTRRHLEKGFSVQSRGRKQVKGRCEPVEVFEVVEPDQQWRFTE